MTSPLTRVSLCKIEIVYPRTAAEAVLIIRKWIEIAKEMDVNIMFETHRDCITNDMFMTLELLDAVLNMRLCADLSYYVLNRELSLPVSEEFRYHFKTLTHRFDCFRGRIPNREQIQIPIGFPQHSECVEFFKQFWEDGLQFWQDRNDKMQSLSFCVN